MNVCPTSILRNYSHLGELVEVEKLTAGLINSTFKVKLKCAEGAQDYVFQCLNSHVFKEPKKVMQNIILVTEHLKSSHLDRQENQLSVHPTDSAEHFLLDVDGNYWRCYNFIPQSTTYNSCHTLDIAKKAAYAFGSFSHRLSSIDLDSIHTTIPNFHHTPAYLATLKQAIKEAPAELVQSCQNEINFILEREELCSLFSEQIKNNTLPLRITHNDTKVNNVLFHTDTQEPLCVIDLDTVMPGLVAYDFGDLVRTMVCAESEESTQLKEIVVRLDYFEALVTGFVHGYPTLTTEELKSLHSAGTVITLELSIRFLSDYLQGNVYFQTSHKEQNLNRCRNQQKLVKELQQSETAFKQIISSLK